MLLPSTRKYGDGYQENVLLRTQPRESMYRQSETGRSIGALTVLLGNRGRLVDITIDPRHS